MQQLGMPHMTAVLGLKGQPTSAVQPLVQTTMTRAQVIAERQPQRSMHSAGRLLCDSWQPGRGQIPAKGHLMAA